MARKPNHAYEKRQRELAKKAKREEKRARKAAAREALRADGTDEEPNSDVDEADTTS